jgi:hypothetical protein
VPLLPLRLVAGTKEFTVSELYAPAVASASASNPEADPFASIPISSSSGKPKAEGNEKLTAHNRRVVAWKDVQVFTGFRADKAAGLRNAMLLAGFSADKETGVCTRTVRWLAADSKTRGCGVRPVSAMPLWRHLKTLEDLGLLTVTRAKGGFADKVRGMDAVNSYKCEFSQVICRKDTKEVQKRYRRGTEAMSYLRLLRLLR